MKKVITVLLLVFALLLQLSIVSAFPLSEDAGEKLKELGVVKGYAKYGLQENRPITEAEFLALVARTIRSKETGEIPDILVQKNIFDEFVNSVYKMLARFKGFVIKNYYLTLSLNSKYEPVKGVKRSSWFFEDALYLRMKGFKFPEDFEPDRLIMSEKVFSYLFSALNMNPENFTRLPENFSKEELLKITLIQQGLLDENFVKKTSLTRGDAFNIILYLYESK